MNQIHARPRGINAHEKKVFSQNGEDGIIEFLVGGLKAGKRVFVEIGTSDGAENNTIRLLHEGWTGFGADAAAENIHRYRARVAGTPMAARLTLTAAKVGWDNCVELIACYGHPAPDLFSLDIDSVDYYVALRLLHNGFRPQVVCCEYNSFLGAEPLTVVYDREFSRYRYDRARGLYFGASVSAWAHLFGRFGYRFCGVESTGVNAFFCLESAFRPDFLDQADGLPFAYNRVFVTKYGLAGEQLVDELLAHRHLAFVDVTAQNVAALAEQVILRGA